MKNVDENYLLSLKNNEESKLLLLFAIEDCVYCEICKETLLSLENEYPELEFAVLTIKNIKELPLFGPASFPTVMFFFGGMKVFEISGGITDRVHGKQLINNLLS